MFELYIAKDRPQGAIDTTTSVDSHSGKILAVGGSKRRPQTVALLAKVPQQFSSFKPA
jgi:hypothetical protein